MQGTRFMHRYVELIAGLVLSEISCSRSPVLLLDRLRFAKFQLLDEPRQAIVRRRSKPT